MLKRYIELYFYMLKLNTKITLGYKANFLIAFFTQLPLQIVEFLFIWVIFQNISSLNGWSFYEMSLIYGIMITCRGLADVFFDNTYEVCKAYIREGTLDTMLTQPINILFNIIAKDFHLGAFGGILLGIAIIAMSISNLAIAFGILQLVLLIVFIFLGALIFGGLMLLACVTSIWIVDSLDVLWSTYVFHQFALYPISLYNTFIKVFITCIFPYAFVSFYPATYLLGKPGGNIAFLAPIVVLIIWLVTINTWKFALKRYGSTGS